MVHLEELNKYNVWEIMDLSVKKEQEGFLASNVWSLVHAYVGNKTNGPYTHSGFMTMILRSAF